MARNVTPQNNLQQTKLLEEVKTRYAHDPNVRAIFVSGSIARGEAGILSDVDVILIVAEPRGYVRFHTGDIEIEVDSLCLEDLPKRLAEDPMSSYTFAELRALHDPESLRPEIAKQAKDFQSGYKATNRAKGDLFVQLNHFRMKIKSAQMEGNVRKGIFFAELALEKIVGALYTLNNIISPPPAHAFKGLLALTIKPSEFPTLLRRLLEGEASERASASLELLDFLLPLLKPSMDDFPQHYQSWKG